MPELPEVETIARQLRAKGVEGRQIDGVEIRWARTVDPLSVDEFVDAIVGETIDSIGRFGKWMMFSMGSGKTVMIHLRMSGSFSLAPGPHDRIVLQLSGGLSLYYCDPRKFGRWKLVDDPQAVLGLLGPDALTRAFTLDGFRKSLQRRTRMIKPLLLDQTIVSGLGNIYADEALWEARIHPERLGNSLNSQEAERLFKAIKHVLRIGVKNRGTSLGAGRSNYRDVDGESGRHRAEVKAYGKSGHPCERCGSLLQKKVVAQRGTHFCPECQHK